MAATKSLTKSQLVTEIEVLRARVAELQLMFRDSEAIATANALKLRTLQEQPKQYVGDVLTAALAKPKYQAREFQRTPAQEKARALAMSSGRSVLLA